MSMNPTNKELVVGLALSKVEVPKGYSLTIQHAPADHSATNATEVTQTTFLMPLMFAKMLREELNRALGQ
jgi:hypothetical protein